MTGHKAESERRAVIAKDTSDLVEAVLAVNEATLHLAEQTRLNTLASLYLMNEEDARGITQQGLIWAHVGRELIDGLGLK